MKQEYQLKITGKDYSFLKEHLFPGDIKEAAAIALCGRGAGEQSIQLLVHRIVPIPYDECSVRESHLVKWPTARLVPLMEEAERNNMSILKIHSHPTWYDNFSNTDNKSDRELFSSVYGWVNDSGPHASAVMLPDGSMFARIIDYDLSFISVDKITIVGDDILFWINRFSEEVTTHNIRTAQAFGEQTTKLISSLRIGVVGCSGTGSLVIEQLHRLKVGELVLVDPDIVEEVNMNRIPYTAVHDAKAGSYKVDVLKSAIESSGLGTKVIAFNKNLYDDENVIRAITSCDIIFGCMDSIDGRHLLNRIATFYLIPYFDLGVKLLADGKGGIEKILSVVHYLQPGLSSLLSRKVYNLEELRAASMKRTTPELYLEQKKLKYIANVDVESPAVISVNMQTACLAVNDFLARLHPYRYSKNSLYSTSIFDITDWSLENKPEDEIDRLLKKYTGRGDMKQLLDMSFV